MRFEKIKNPIENFDYKKSIKAILISALLSTNLLAKNYKPIFPPAKINFKIPNYYETEGKIINKINKFYLDNRSKFPPFLNENFFKIIKEIESSNNTQAFNKNTGATGLMQVTDTCIKDVLESINIYTKNKFYFTTKDQIKIVKEKILKNPELGEQIGELYFYFLYKRYNIKNIKNLLIAYNGGLSYLNKNNKNKLPELPEETKNYIKKYKRLSQK